MCRTDTVRVVELPVGLEKGCNASRASRRVQKGPASFADVQMCEDLLDLGPLGRQQRHSTLAQSSLRFLSPRPSPFQAFTTGLRSHPSLPAAKVRPRTPLGPAQPSTRVWGAVGAGGERCGPAARRGERARSNAAPLCRRGLSGCCRLAATCMLLSGKRRLRGTGRRGVLWPMRPPGAPVALLSASFAFATTALLNRLAGWLWGAPRRARPHFFGVPPRPCSPPAQPTQPVSQALFQQPPSSRRPSGSSAGLWAGLARRHIRRLHIRSHHAAPPCRNRVLPSHTTHKPRASRRPANSLDECMPEGLA